MNVPAPMGARVAFPDQRYAAPGTCATFGAPSQEAAPGSARIHWVLPGEDRVWTVSAVRPGRPPNAQRGRQSRSRRHAQLEQSLCRVPGLKPSELLARLERGAAKNVDFADAQRLAEALGFQELRVVGSHHIYARPGVPELVNLQERRGQAKPYQLHQLAALARRYNLQVEE